MSSEQELPPIGLIVSPFLDPVEAAHLEAQGLVAQDYAAIIAPAAGLQMQMARGQNGRPLLVVVLQVALDYEEILPLKMSTVLDPRTKQPKPSEEAKKTIPVSPPPMVRLFVRAESLGKAAQRELSRIKMAHVTAMMGAPPSHTPPTEES